MIKPMLHYRSTGILPILTFLLILNASFAPLAYSRPEGDPVMMKKGLPVWAEGREKEMNLNLGFRGVFKATNNLKATLRITGSTIYRVFVNGQYLGYGPARAGHGYFRVDEYDLTKWISSGENIVAVEVAGYNVNTYYTLDQPSFLQAEVESAGEILLATGTARGFQAFQIKERLQKVERYSFQRPFTEYYRLKANFDRWKTSTKVPVESLKTTTSPSGKLLPRNLLLPEFKIVRPVSVCSNGTVAFKKPAKYYKDRSLRLISDKFKGYMEEELEVSPSQAIQEISTKTIETTSVPFPENGIAIHQNEFSTFDFGIDLSGFIGAKLTCQEPAKVYFYFDEVLSDGDVNAKRRMADVNNQVVYELEPGTYNLESFEPYTFKYLKVIVVKGSCRIQELTLREYAYPENPKATFKSSNPKLNEIYKASRQSFRQNAVDLLTDCPSRERAGWLCDSYFSAIMEKDFTGHAAVTHNFYENYALPDSFAFLPRGMIPMCYPADHNDGVFIPNWAMWFVIQVNDYAQRGGDPILIARLRPRIEGILDYFNNFENKDGLLENLQSWIFVEWSKANSFVKDVNYPTNMLYAALLSNAADLYNNNSWRQKSEQIKQTIQKQSYNGTFFVDNGVRNKGGKLEITNNTTEVCQYYAFYFNVATPQTHPELWKKLTTEFGPARNDQLTWPNVFRANAFVGNYMRMDILSRYGLKTQLMSEIQDYFYAMAKTTGTLWENMSSEASCNHGFASYIGHVLYRDVLGISRIDYINKAVTIEFTDSELKECSGAIPVDDSAVELTWKRTGNQIKYSVKIPPGYKVNIDNQSSAEVKRNEN
jgi:alpha-L-rhamnosidase